jgi:two-component sensor histidine kinase
MNNVVKFRVDTDRLVRSEADHRIANNLSVISSLVRLKAQHPRHDDIHQFLTDIACRIDTVGQLHRLLAHARAGRVPAARFLRDACTTMKVIAGGDDRLQVSIECPESLTLSPESALRVGLLTSELFSNSVKYAHPTAIPTSIQVSCRPDHESVVFSFEDDGIGLPENFDPSRSDSLGMQILHLLSHELRGACEWQDLGIGLRFVCRFPSSELTGRARS